MTNLPVPWNPNRFTFQFAIRTPSGQIYSTVPEVPRKESGLFASLWLSNDPPPAPVPAAAPKPVIFDTREEAEAKLAELREQAQRVGVDNYGAAVVTRICSPFSDLPSPTQFADHVSEWLQREESAS